MSASGVRRLAMLSLLLPAALGADEGMWTFDNPPLKRLQEVYGFTPSPSWLEKVRLASVRFNDGGSGSFVSGNGLMITNHHVGLGCIQNLSAAGKDYVAGGYLASSREKEPACPGYEVNVLVSIEDVTSRVLGAVKPEMSDKAAGEARKAARAQIEKECADRTKQRCDVIQLYQGSEYHLYNYKKYTDVRLVFAPEQQAAFFGGDPDNFTFPRHDLDVAIFRAYEDGKPARPAAYLPWSTAGAGDNELVFVSGNPGSTSRLRTTAQLESERDVTLPAILKFIKSRLAVLREYSAQGPENERRARAQVLGLENAQKALEGQLAALQDAKAMAEKTAKEKEFQEKAPVLFSTGAADPWAAIAAAEKKAASRNAELRFVGFGGSRLLGIAGQIVRYGVEKGKPNDVRLEEYRESNLASLENRLYSPAPIYDDLEVVTLTNQLQLAAEALGKEHPFIKSALGGKSAAELAKEAVSSTKLKDVAARKALVAGGPPAVEASGDPMIVLARRIDPLARELRKWNEDEVQAIIARAGEKLAQARWKAYGKTLPPDATFTLRLAYGTVKGYPAEGTVMAPRTTFHGLYDRASAFGNKPPWNLSRRFAEKKSALDLATPLDFVSTADITGGNSGSPVVNRSGEFVGIIFDSNIHGLALDYFYTEERARAIAVESRGIIESLRKVYDAGAVADELTAK